MAEYWKRLYCDRDIKLIQVGTFSLYTLHFMGSHPINLAVRFLLEIIGLVALGLMGWHIGKGFYMYAMALGLPLVAAVLWGVFAVPGDPSRSGGAPVQISGINRLGLELTFFISATWSLFATGATILGWAYGVATIVHYLISYDRVLWLIHK